MLLNKRQWLLPLLILILAHTSAEAEMVTGTVLSVDREQSVFILSLAREQNIAVYTDIFPLPGRVATGRTVRIWGTYDSDSNNFIATDIRGPGRNLRHDPTGARARITSGGHCPNCARYKSPENENQTTEEDSGESSAHGDSR